ncbi:MAG: hypothetical protein ABIU05_24470 [Nitrospirales bacterium]
MKPHEMSPFHVLIISNDGAPATEVPFIDEVYSRFIEEPRQVCLMLPPTTFADSRANAVAIPFEGIDLLISSDGWVSVSGHKQDLPTFLMESYANFGWDIFSNLKSSIDKLSQSTGIATNSQANVRGIWAIIDATEHLIRQRVAIFLETFEQEMLASLKQTLEMNRANARLQRDRYLDKLGELKRTPDGELETPCKELYESLIALLALRKAYAEHEQLYRNLAALNTIPDFMQLLPWRLTTIWTPPKPDEMKERWGPDLGAILEELFRKEITDYRTGRDCLLAAMADIVGSNQKEHLLLPILWRNLSRPFTEESLASDITSLCAKVIQACEMSLAQHANGDFSLLLQKVDIIKNIEPYPVWASIYAPSEIHTYEYQKTVLARHANLDHKLRPEQELASLLTSRESDLPKLLSRVAGIRDIPGQLNLVTVWDMDLIRAETEHRLSQDGQIEFVEQVALTLLDNQISWKSLTGALKDIGINIALSISINVASAPGAIGFFTLLGIYEAAQEWSIVKTQGVLATSEEIAAVGSVRRIISRQPSFVPLLLSLMGIAGGVSALSKLQKLAKVLDDAQLLLAAATFLRAVSEQAPAVKIAIGELIALGLKEVKRQEGK